MLACAPAGVVCGQGATAALQALYERYERWGEVPYTTWGASLEAFDRHGAALEVAWRDFRDVDSGGLSEADRINHDVFEALLEGSLDFYRARGTMPVTAGSGIHVWLAEWGTNRGRWSAGELEAFARDSRSIPGLIDTTIGRLERGLARGWTPPRDMISRTPREVEALLEEGLTHLGWPFALARESGDRAHADALWHRFSVETRPEIEAALRRLARYLRETYLPRCRTSLGVGDLPGGAAWYARRLRTVAETPLSPEAVHELGLAEVARIESEMVPLILKTDFAGAVPPAAGRDGEQILAAFNAFLRSDARFRFDGPEAVVREYCRVAKNVDGWLPGYFGRLPRLPFAIIAAPPPVPVVGPALYRLGDLSQGVASVLFVNPSADQHRTFQVTPLVLHEAMPGHHLQLALTRELDDAPAFRRDAFFPAFGEGWALYAESLGLAMGMYAGEYDRLGLLGSEMHRACRLVVDTGVNALGWSRERAVTYLASRTALSPEQIEVEIERYVTDPGQACSYKIGELRIRELRAEAERRLGAGFDQRSFHDVVLGAGSVPLVVLERRVRAWIDGLDGAPD